MIISQTPLRVSFAGGGTDLKEYYSIEKGCVVSVAIDKYVYVGIKERFDNLIVLHYSKNEIVQSVEQIKHDLIRETMKLVGIDTGVEIITLADIPSEGTGLGSSSSLTVGLLNAFYAFKGEQVDSERLAREACKVEIDILKKPIGKQDQYIAAYGGLKKFEFLPDDSVITTNLKISDEERRRLSNNLCLFYSNITRKADIILSEQKKNTIDKKKYLDGIRDLAYETEISILNRDFDNIGIILRKNWELKKKLASGITNLEIDKIMNIALNGGGAIGGKVTGAGGGGFIILYSKQENKDNLKRHLTGYKELPFFIEKDGSKIIFNYRGYDSR